jgi:hypothetical protein
MGVYYGKADFITYGKPSLVLDFANKKSLVDRISGNNLITFSRNSVGTYVGSDGLIKTASANEARFDHDPLTGESLGLLVEEQRINYHTNNSNNLFTMAYSNWTSDSSILYPNGGTVGGYNTFDQLSGARFFLDYNPGPGNTTYTCSVYARLKTGSSATSCSVVVKDWQSDTVRGSSGSITLTNSWQRISATGTTAGGTAGLRFEIGTNTSGASSQIYLWGAQVEQGDFPTSYIPTTTSQVTRSAEVPNITGTNFSSWYNQSQGTFLVKSKLLPSSGSQSGNALETYVEGSGTANGVSIMPNYLNGGKARIEVPLAGDYTARAIDSNSLSYSNEIKMATAIQDNNVGLSVNGVLYNSLTNKTIAQNVTAMRIGGPRGTGGSNILCGTISRITYWPTRIPNSLIQSLSS